MNTYPPEPPWQLWAVEPIAAFEAKTARYPRWIYRDEREWAAADARNKKLPFVATYRQRANCGVDVQAYVGGHGDGFPAEVADPRRARVALRHWGGG
jgi:hypothetical protein